MRLDVSNMRYLTSNDFRVLKAIEQGSRNHEVVPTTMICNLSGLKSISRAHRSIGDLAKVKLISKVRNSKYDGYKLNYSGFDYVAIKSMLNRETVYSIGNTIGVGKESDIYKVSDKNGNPRVMKIHRLGRTSFTCVKNKRDYLKHSNQGTSWMHLSSLGAHREFEFLLLLHSKGFQVPEPFDNSRHMVIMEFVEGFPLKNLRNYSNVPKLYSDLMNFAVRLAKSGLVHCDYNEFNIIIRDSDVKGPDGCEFAVIDFPQCVSIEHPDAEYFFQRDIECIRRFFRKKLKYDPKPDSSMLDTDGFGDGYKYPFPIFRRDVIRCDHLDELTNASGFTKRKLADSDLIGSPKNMKDDKLESDFEDYNDYNEQRSSEESDDQVRQNDQNEYIIEALSKDMDNLKMDKLGNYILE